MKKETYEILWKDGIKAKSEQIVNDNAGKVVFDSEAKERIFKEYSKLTPLYNFLKNKITHKTLSHV